MVNYQNGKIYKIESIKGKCQYIGSTCQLLCQRMAKHKTSYRKNYYKNTMMSKEVLKYDDAKIYLIENYPCNSKEELTAKEAEYIKKYDCVNIQIPDRTRKQYYQDHKEIIKKRTTDRRNKNKDITNCICGSSVVGYNIKRHMKSKKHITYINNNGVQKLPQE